MGLIKASSPAAARPIAFSMTDVEQQARSIIVRAKQQAAQLLTEAQTAGEDIRRQAHAEGLAAGFEEGVAKGMEEGGKLGHAQALEENRNQFTVAIAALNAAAAEIDNRRRELDSDALRDVVNLSVKIADRVTKRQGEYDSSVLMANVAECLRLVVGTHDLRIAIHPMQKAILSDALPRLKLEFPSLKHVELTEDETLQPGGCRIFTRQGHIDADLDTQLTRIAQELLPTESA
jgi:flagellar assembly protein FliH